MTGIAVGRHVDQLLAAGEGGRGGEGRGGGGGEGREGRGW